MAGTVDWRRVAKTTLHPTQVEILEATAARDRLSPVQFCSNGEAVSRVAYQRGAIEHYSRLSRDARG